MHNIELKDWVGLLKEEIDIHKRVLEVAQKKTTFLVEGNVHEIETINRLENGLVLMLGNSKEKRENLIQKTAALLDVSVNDINLTFLKDKMNPDEAKILESVQQEFLIVVKDLQASHDTNRKLIEHSLEFVEFSIELFSSIHSAGDHSYSKEGNLNEYTNRRSMFDAKR